MEKRARTDARTDARKHCGLVLRRVEDVGTLPVLLTLLPHAGVPKDFDTGATCVSRFLEHDFLSTVSVNEKRPSISVDNPQLDKT